jgi:hypothetical protein
LVTWRSLVTGPRGVRNVDENLIAVGAEKHKRYYYSNLRPLGA